MKRRNPLVHLQPTPSALALTPLGWVVLGSLLASPGLASDLEGPGQGHRPALPTVTARTSPQSGMPATGGWGTSTLADPAASFVFTPVPESSVAGRIDPLAPLALPHGSQGDLYTPTLTVDSTPANSRLAPLAEPYGQTQLSAYPKLSPGTVTATEFSSPAPSQMPLGSETGTPLPIASSLQPSTLAAPGSYPVLVPPSASLAVSPTALPNNQPVTPPSVVFQPSVIQVGDDFSARARLQGHYFLSPNVMVGAAFDLSTGNAFSDTQSTGFSVNELYVAASPGGAPNLRFAAGQLDLTSYFDRNSFAKDSLTHFVNPVFQTNPALAATAVRSRPAALVNWRASDALEFRAAAFSSSGIENFALDGFAGEVGLSLGNFILRGTYVSATDAGNGDSFAEIFATDRGNGVFGPLPDDREIAYGVNAEWFIPEANLGFFGRYGRQENQALGLSGETYSGGLNLLNLFMDRDRLGIGYGRGLSNEGLRQQQNRVNPDVFEVFYDFPLAPNVRAAVDFQQRNSFSETVLGFRIRANLELLNQTP